MPADTLRKVIKIARFNGMVVVFPTACLCALVEAAMGDWFGTIIGFLVAAAGWSEWHGAKLLQRGEARGVGWLVRSQLYLLGLIWVYALMQMYRFNPDYMHSIMLEINRIAGINFQDLLETVGYDAKDVIQLGRTFCYALYGSFALVAVFYQGGLALFYQRRAAAVRIALAGGDRHGANTASGPAGTKP
jgi:hypothetical protein